MLSKQANLHRRRLTEFWVTLGILTLTAMISGCFENYGRLKRNPEVTRAFKENRVDNDYRYYYYGRSNQPYVVVGIDQEYHMESKMWRTVDHETDAFKDMIYWIWTDITYYYNSELGADILDPGGKKVGLWYSNIWWAAVRFHEDNRIEIMPDIKMGGGR
jgi:hypothetical protein